MIEEKGKKLSKLLYISYTLFLLLFLGIWQLSNETNYIPLLILILGLVLPLIGYFLTFFLVKMIDAKDPRSHFFVVLNIVVLLLTLLALAVSVLIFYTDSLQSELGAEHNAQVNAFIDAGDVDGCINYLIGTKLVSLSEAQTTCNLRIAIVTKNSSLCENIPEKDEKQNCLSIFE